VNFIVAPRHLPPSGGYFVTDLSGNRRTSLPFNPLLTPFACKFPPFHG